MEESKEIKALQNYDYLKKWVEDQKKEGGSLEINVGGCTLAEAFEKARKRVEELGLL